MDLLTKGWDEAGCLDKTISVEGVPTLGCIWVAIQNIINVFTALAGVVALLLIIYSGIKFITSRGDKEKVENAKKTLTFAIIGLIFILFAAFIIKVISDLTGIGADVLRTVPNSPPQN